MKKLTVNLLLTLLTLVVASPIGLYWFGLSNIDGLSKPPQLDLSESEVKAIWSEAGESGIPKIVRLSPYSYLHMIATCQSKCSEEYPGARLASLSVRNEVRSKLEKPSNLQWQLTWMAYSIWVTRNWTTEQIVLSYKVSFDA